MAGRGRLRSYVGVGVAVVIVAGVGWFAGTKAAEGEMVFASESTESAETDTAPQGAAASTTTTILATTTTAAPTTTTTTAPTTTTTRVEPELVHNTVGILGALDQLLGRAAEHGAIANSAMDNQDSSTLSSVAGDMRDLAQQLRDLAKEATDPIAREGVNLYEASIIKNTHGLDAMAHGIRVGDIDEINKAGAYFIEASDVSREARILMDRAQDNMWNFQQD